MDITHVTGEAINADLVRRLRAAEARVTELEGNLRALNAAHRELQEAMRLGSWATAGLEPALDREFHALAQRLRAGAHTLRES